MRVKIAKWGNSAAIRLPKAVMEEMRLKPGADAELRVENKEIHISLVSNPKRLTREQLIKSMDRFGLAGESETIDWGADRGSERIEDDYSGKIAGKADHQDKKRAF